jgi:hypothetical protein
MDKNQAIEYINSMDELSQEKKTELVAEVNAGADIVSVLDRIEGILQNEIDKTFKEAGVVLDQNDPEYLARHKEMMDEMQVAEEEFDQEMRAINEDEHSFHVEVGKKMDDLKINELNEQLNDLE